MTFPESELPGVDLIIPDLTYLQQHRHRIAALVLTHGHEDHIGAVPYLLPLVHGPVYGTPLTLAMVAPKLEEHGLDAEDRLNAVKPRDVVDGRPIPDRVPARHAQHARLRGGGDPHAGRHRHPHRRLQGRSDADRRRAVRLPSLRRARRRRACWRCSPTARTSIARASSDPSAKSSTPSRRSSPHAGQDRRRDVLVEHLSHAGASSTSRRSSIAGSRSSAAAWTRTRRSRSALGYLRIPAGVQMRDSDVRNYPGRDVVCIIPGRRASRWRRCRGSRSTITGTSSSGRRHGGVLRARDPRQRARHRPRDESHRAARRRRHL